MARNFFCSGQKGVDAPQKSAGFSFGAGNVEITASNIFSKVTFFKSPVSLQVAGVVVWYFLPTLLCPAFHGAG